MIEKQVMPWIQVAARVQERPYAMSAGFHVRGRSPRGIVARAAATSSGRAISTTISYFMGPSPSPETRRSRSIAMRESECQQILRRLNRRSS